MQRLLRWIWIGMRFATTQVGLVLMFGFWFMVSVAVHLPMAPSRRALAAFVTAQMNASIRGSIRIGDVTSLWVQGLRAKNVRVYDPGGRLVLQADELKATWSLADIVLSVLRGGGGVRLGASWVHVPRLQVMLRPGPGEVVSLSSTFASRKETAVTPATPSSPAGGGQFTVSLPDIQIDKLHVRGDLGGWHRLQWDANRLRGAVIIQGDDVRVDVQPFTLQVHRVLPTPLNVVLDYHFRSPDRMWSRPVVTYQGTVLSLDTSMSAQGVRVSADIPKVPPSLLAQWLPSEVRPVDDTELHVSAHGTLPVLNLSAAVRDGKGRVDVVGSVRADPSLLTSLRIHGSRIDASRWLRGAPETSVEFRGELELRKGEDGAVRSHWTAKTEPFSIGDVLVPAMDLDARYDPSGLYGELVAHEQGMDARADFRLMPDGDAHSTVRVEVPELARVARLGKGLRGKLKARAEVFMKQGNVEVKVAADAERIQIGGTRLAGAHVLAQVARGKNKKDWELLVGVDGRGLGVGNVQWARWNLGASGRWNQMYVSASASGAASIPDVRVSGTLLPNQHGTGVTGLQAVLIRAGRKAVVRAKSLHVGNGIDAEGIEVQGLGEPLTGSVHATRKKWKVTLRTTGLDLRELSSLFGWSSPSLEGKLGADIDWKASGEQNAGCVRVDLRKGRIAGIGNLWSSTRVLFSGANVEMRWRGGVRSVGRRLPSYGGMESCLSLANERGRGSIVSFDSRASLVLAGKATEVDSWRRASGTLSVEPLEVDLDLVERVRKSFASLGVPLPVSKLAGRARLRLDAMRAGFDGPVSTHVELATRGFHVDAGREPGKYLDGDVRVVGALDERGELTVGACLRKSSRSRWAPEACDPADAEVLVTMGGRLSLADWLQGKKKFSQWWRRVQVQGRLVVLDRPASNLFDVFAFRPKGWKVDRVAARVDLTGSWFRPEMSARFRMLTPGPEDDDWSLPTLVCAKASFVRDRLAADAELLRFSPFLRSIPLGQACEASSLGRRVSLQGAVPSLGHIKARFELPWCGVRGDCSAEKWTGDVRARLHDIELGLVPALAKNDVRGTASLAVDLTDIGRHPEFEARFVVQGLQLSGQARYDETILSMHAGATGIDGQLEVKEREGEGKLRSRLRVSMNTRQVSWAAGPRMQIDPDQPAYFDLRADDFSIGLLSPLLQPAVRHIDGSLTGVASAVWLPADEGFDVRRLFLSLNHGAFQIPTLGQEFLDVSALLQSGKGNRLFLQDFSARALAGRLRGYGQLDLEGFHVSKASAVVYAEPKEKMRVTFQGVPLGDVYGKALVDFWNRKDYYDMVIAVRDAHMSLVDHELRSVQHLDLNPDIEVVPNLESVTKVIQGDGQGATERAKAKPWKIRFRNIGPIVVERTGMRLALEMLRERGKSLTMTLRPGQPSELTGQIHIAEGHVDVVDKEFVVDPSKALVVFHGDPAHPTLNVTAHWDAPDGTRVFADVTGDIGNPRVRLRSNPARPPSEVLAMVVFGVQSGSGRTAGGSSDEDRNDTAAQVGGGVAAAGVNVLLSDLAPVNISTRLDSTHGQSVSPTLVVQVSDNVSAEATYVPETRLDQSDRYLLTLDWRFLRQWSLRTTVGDQGSSVVDVLWQHRY